MFGTYFHPRVMLGRTELPALRRNPSVGPDRIRFVHTPPERLSNGPHLTDTMLEVLAAPGDQACIQFDAPELPGYLDVRTATGFSRQRLEEEVAVLRAEVEASDRAWSLKPITPDRPAGVDWFPPVVGQRRTVDGLVTAHPRP